MLPAITEKQVHFRQISQEIAPKPGKCGCFCWPFCPKPLPEIPKMLFEPRQPSSPLRNKQIDRVRLTINTAEEVPLDDFKNSNHEIIITPRTTSVAVSNYISKVMAEPI